MIRIYLKKTDSEKSRGNGMYTTCKTLPNAPAGGALVRVLSTHNPPPCDVHPLVHGVL